MHVRESSMERVVVEFRSYGVSELQATLFGAQILSCTRSLDAECSLILLNYSILLAKQMVEKVVLLSIKRYGKSMRISRRERRLSI